MMRWKVVAAPTISSVAVGVMPLRICCGCRREGPVSQIRQSVLETHILFHREPDRFVVADKLTGDGNANRITGSLGPDLQTGLASKNTFVFNAVVDSPPGAGRDKITDFDAGDAATSVDKIDVSA